MAKLRGPAKPQRTARLASPAKLSATERALGSLRVERQRLLARENALQQRHKRESLLLARASIRAARGSGRPILRVLAEGDSWMSYECGIGVMSNIQWQLGARGACLNLAHSGDTMRKMMKLPERAELDRELRRGIDGAPWDVLIFSGGGNDVAGDEFLQWLLPYAGQKNPADAIAQPRFSALLADLAALYGDLASRVHSYSPATRVLLNAYDFAIPSGKGVWFAGPWLAPGFTARGYDATPLAFRTAVVKLLLQQFAAMLRDVSKIYPFLRVMPTQGVLTRGEWANELHPTNAGFKREAAVFMRELDAMVKKLGDDVALAPAQATHHLTRARPPRAVSSR